MEAVEYFKQGYSCSESIIMYCIDKGICDESLLHIATAFSGGLGNGCLCGAVSGSVMIIGYLFGKNNKFGNEVIARPLTKEFINKFKQSHKVTCCRALSQGFDFHSPERKAHCCNFVDACSKLLDEIISANIKNG